MGKAIKRHETSTSGLNQIKIKSKNKEIRRKETEPREKVGGGVYIPVFPFIPKLIERAS